MDGVRIWGADAFLGRHKALGKYAVPGKRASTVIQAT